jgi:hypothetical protein
MTPSVKIEHAGRPEAHSLNGTIAMFAPNPNRRLRETIFLGGVVVGAAALGAVVLYAATTWLWLVVHEGLR